MDINTIILEEYKQLGKGVFGRVFEKNGFAFKITKSKEEAEFTQKIKENYENLNVFPKIYWVKKSPKGYYVVKRELLKPLKPTEMAYINNYMYDIGFYINNNRQESLEKLKNSKLSDKFMNFILRLKEDVNTINMNKTIDVHGGNIGINQNGDYILFDF